MCQKERLTLNEAQSIQRLFDKWIGVDTSVEERWRRAVREVRELEEAVGAFTLNPSPRALESVAEEAADVLIMSLAIISSTGYDAERLFWRKIDKAFRKHFWREFDEEKRRG